MTADPKRTVRAVRNRIEGGLTGADVAQPGEMWPRSTMRADAQVVRHGYALYCPGCGSEAWIPTDPATPEISWAESGDLDAGTLTLTPSLAMRCCNWHGWLRDGVFTPV
jgi:hypothetical protein